MKSMFALFGILFLTSCAYFGRGASQQPVVVAATHTAAAQPSVVEQQTVVKRARDAWRAPKQERLAYLHCYALKPKDKSRCQEKIQRKARGGRLIAYQIAYVHEAERLGFADFLRSRGRSCRRVDVAPSYQKASNVFEVRCVQGSRYRVRFDYTKKRWNLIR